MGSKDCSPTSHCLPLPHPRIWADTNSPVGDSLNQIAKFCPELIRRRLIPAGYQRLAGSRASCRCASRRAQGWGGGALEQAGLSRPSCPLMEGFRQFPKPFQYSTNPNGHNLLTGKLQPDIRCPRSVFLSPENNFITDSTCSFFYVVLNVIS